ncbi:MAG: GH36-type glycosyl hydrolase domain-containing protein [Candidatus Hermodarchaeota archaeon]
MTKKSFGSGHFGEWIEDEFGLRAYRYTCNQTKDPKAVSPMSEVWRPKTDHIHQVGNDRLVAVVSNYGHVQVRQDEGSPKFLNDFDPSTYHFGGGFGYLTDGESFLSTYYSGEAEEFERVFGMGYFRKTAEGSGLVADQVIFAPFGDDPIIISQVTIKNERNRPVDLRWIEYWGCQQYQFSYKSFMLSLAQRRPASELRREFSRRFDHKIGIVGERQGLLNSNQFKGNTLASRMAWRALNAYLSTKGKHLTGGPVKSPVKEAVLEDETPPPTFLVSLDAPVDAHGTDVKKFFGEGGVNNPDGIHEPLSLAPSRGDSEVGLLLERRLHLDPGSEMTLYFAYGYLHEKVTLDALLKKYQQDPSSLLADSSKQWRSNRIQLVLDDEGWVDRELSWHNYYLRSNLTFDSYFQEYILSQGHMYQYIIGFQGAARDPLQHVLPFVFSQPEIVKTIIRYTLKTVTPEGDIPYGIAGSGMYMPAPWKPSDQPLWLLWLASEYVLATRDMAFLDEMISTYPVYGRKAGKARVRDLLLRCFKYLVESTGTGKHGLIRLSNGDWNDGVILGYVPDEKREEVVKVAESVLNASMASYVLALYSQLLRCADEPTTAKEAMAHATKQCEAVRNQWTGSWFRRAWLGEELGWVGTDVMWLEPQPWSIIGGAADKSKAKILVRSVNDQVRQSPNHGATLLSSPLDEMAGSGGVGINAGVWPSINGTLIWALALMDGKLAWDEWKKNTLTFHAEVYPEIWYGIWSGPDTYNSDHSERPGHTIIVEERTGVRESIAEGEIEDEGFMGVGWSDFPVFNMHPHAWPLYSTAKLMGIEFTVDGVELAPSLPHEKYAFTSPLLDFKKSDRGYSGRYAPLASGTWKIAVKLATSEVQRVSNAVVNGKEVDLIREGDRLTFSGESSPEEPLIWTLEY